MALFDALERIYGVPRSSFAATPDIVPKPHPHTIRDFLLHYYPDAACRAAGFEQYRFAPIPAICPIVRPLAQLPIAVSEDTIAPPAPSLPADLLAAYTAPLRNASLWDADIYRLIAFEFGQACATFDIARFLEARLTTGLMRDELQYALSMPNARFPLREQIAPTPAALLDFRSHLTGGGVHTLCAFARPSPYNDFVIPLQRRSTRVGVAGGSYGVIPMAFHQPAASGPLDPREPATTALREIFEELLGGTETHDQATFLTHPAIEWLQAHPADVHFETTNLFVSLLGGNYDFSLMLAVTNTDFWQSYGALLQTGWESEQHFLLSSQDNAAFHKILTKPDWEAQALGCCLDGLRRLRVIAPERTLKESYDPAF